MVKYLTSSGIGDALDIINVFFSYTLVLIHVVDNLNKSFINA
jgi:hypothetical protein